jgi:DNA-binding NarL/FixJ family response regulator
MAMVAMDTTKPKITKRKSLYGVPLSYRQREVALFVKAGLEDREIAKRLKISYQTIKNHLHAIYSKLGVSTRTQLAIWITRNDGDASEELSWYEMEIIKYVAWGYTDKEISEFLQVHKLSITGSIKAICSKLRLRNRIWIALWHENNHGSGLMEAEQNEIVRKPLGKRQYEIAVLISEGLDNKAISEKLGLTLQTVKNHVTVICRKLKVKNRTQVAAWVFKNSEGVNDGQNANN